MPTGNEALQITVSLSHAEYSPRSEAWAQERRALMDALRRSPDVNDLQRIERGVEGTRGGIPEIVVSLAHAGAFTSVVLIVRAWLARHEARGVELTLQNGTGGSVSFKADALKNGDVQELTDRLVAALRAQD